VLTFVGAPEAVGEAAARAIKVATELIDLRRHDGKHPRVGATDVVPFVPIQDVSMEECVQLARGIGQRVSADLGIPVFFYEQAATHPDHVKLENIRRGGLQGLASRIVSDPTWAPDFGPARPHETAGASVIGARMPLIAYNINLNTERIDVAKKIAAAIRFSGGGFRYVKAMGVKVDDRNLAQVSMNLTNHEKTPIFRVFELVKREAARYGVSILESEIVGLVPSAALVSAAEFYLQLERFSGEQVLETRLRAAE